MDVFFSEPILSFSFQIGLMEIVLPSELFADKIFSGHLIEAELDDTIAVEFEIPINLLLDKLRSDVT